MAVARDGNTVQAVIKRYLNGESSRKIAGDYDFSYKTVLLILKENNVTRRKQNYHLKEVGFKKGNIPKLKGKPNIKIRGSRNNLWKGGISRHYGRRIASQAYYVACSHCGTKENLHTHHIDEDPQNNNLLNLQILCASHHKLLHVRGRL